MTNFNQFKGATTSKKDFYEKNVFGPNLEYILLIFYNKISQIPIILKYLNKFPITQLVHNQMWQYFYG
jgi:hypothetical protein